MSSEQNPEGPESEDDIAGPEFTVEAVVKIDPHDVVAGLRDNEIVEFIKRIDELTENWDVTLELADHFAALKQIYLREVKESEPEKGGEG